MRPELVSSYGIELGDDFVLFDPLSVPGDLRERATSVVLTAPYHERDARQLAPTAARPAGRPRPPRARRPVGRDALERALS